ncbi:ankyrin repeat domain-containing protein [Terrabacter carboxydivorans]|uniref:Ankyrin repeat domain-containing protein n=1 Tax=Terrabacter carboxydivorans TaxID=619730 RepID=A0ABP5ZIH9_9MICO
MSESPPSTRQQEQEQIVAVAMDLARDGRTADLVEFLDHGYPVDLPDPAGNTLLMLAAYHGHLDTVSTLVARGADVDRRNDRDQSPVAGAMFKGEDEVVRALVAAGADLDAGSPTARETARLFGQQHLVDGQE